MQNYKVIFLSHRIAVIGLLSCFFLFALTLTVHYHTAAVDHVQHECALCLIGAPSKAFVVSLPVLPVYYEVRALFVVATPNRVALPFWYTTSSRSPPPLV